MTTRESLQRLPNYLCNRQSWAEIIWWNFLVMRWHGKCPHVLNAPPTLRLSLYGVSFFFLPFLIILAFFALSPWTGFSFLLIFFYYIYTGGGGYL